MGAHCDSLIDYFAIRNWCFVSESLWHYKTRKVKPVQSNQVTMYQKPNIFKDNCKIEHIKQSYLIIIKSLNRCGMMYTTGLSRITRTQDDTYIVSDKTEPNEETNRWTEAG